MKITKVIVKNFCGLEHCEVDVPPDGIVAKGGNRKGKTSLLRAIHAGFTSQGVGPEAIRIGAERAEILIETDALLKVRKAITAKGDSLTVTNAQGDKWARPQSRLTEMLGTTLDPLAFFLAKGPDRRKQILAAMPAQVTAEDMALWTGGRWEGSVDGHGLEVIGRARAEFYFQRTGANRVAKASAEAAKAKQATADELAAKAPPVAVDVAVAQAQLAAAMAAISLLEQRQAQAEAQEKRAAGTREKIALLRGEAEEIAMRGPVVPPLSERNAIDSQITAHRDRIATLKRELAAEGELLAAAQAKLDDFVAREEAGNRATAAAAQKLQQAADLEASLASVAIAAPTPEEIAAAADAGCKARDAWADAEAAAVAAHALAEFRAAHAQAEADAETAGELDAIVEALTTKAPAELAKRSETIPGLAITGDAITLDGRAIDNLSGAEQLRFAVDLAKRASKAKILVVDGLERLDATQMREFVAYACAGGWQLLATRVTDGDLTIEAIEPGRVTVVGVEAAS
jgi:hypothetical protein